jgi:hypothetical protein
MMQPSPIVHNHVLSRGGICSIGGSRAQGSHEPIRRLGLEDDFPLGIGYFQGQTVDLLEDIM